MIFCLTNAFVEAEATLASLVQHHRDLPRDTSKKSYAEQRTYSGMDERFARAGPGTLMRRARCQEQQLLRTLWME